MDEGYNILKRKNSDCASAEDDDDCKKFKISPGVVHILGLPDCLLLTLFSYVDATSLYRLSRTCVRFENLVSDSRLWRYVDGRRFPNNATKVQYCERHVNGKTTHILFCADERHKQVLSRDFFGNRHTMENLQVLALENQRINGQKYPLRVYPQTLQELSLRRSFVSGGGFFFRFAKNLDKLRVLILDHCQWVESSNLVSIANFKNLEILSMYMCKKLSDLSIGYVSLAGHGFKSLKILDVRFTGLGNRMITSLYKSSTIQEMYFQGYCTTYHLERSRRKLAIIRGAQRAENSYLSDDDEHNDLNARKLQKRFGIQSAVMTNVMDVVDDVGVFMFKYLKVNEEQPPRPESFLFRDVYRECRCGFQAKHFPDFRVNVAQPSTSRTRRRRPKEDLHDTSSDEDEMRVVTKKMRMRIRKHRRNLRYMLHTRHVPEMFFITNDEKEFTGAADEEVSQSIYNLDDRELNNELELSQIEHTIVSNRTMHTVVIVDLFQRAGGLEHRQEVVRMSRASSDMQPEIIWPSSSDNDDETISSASEGSPCLDPSSSSDDDVYDLPEHIVLGGSKGPIKTCMKRMSLCGFPKISDRSLQNLSGLNLELLDVRYTNVTEEGVKLFMVQNPGCRVVHEQACICGPRLHF